MLQEVDMDLAAAYFFHERAIGTELVPIPADLVPIMPMDVGLLRPPSAMPSESMARFTELQRFLAQCDDPSYVQNYSLVR